MPDPVRIAMWSGPRNISTALMRSFGNRPDTFVCDEPLYAQYLRAKPDVAHPGRDEVIAHHETDWRKVVDWLTGPVPQHKAVFYQKHMAHHLLPEIDRGWLDTLTHCFLIREPREMLTSLLKKYSNVTLADTGLPQQVEIFEYVRERTGRTPPVLDARDVLGNPRRVLGLLCDRLEIEFTDAMLSWPPGRRETDGAWAKYWYDAVEKTTGFQLFRPKDDELPERFGDLHGACDRYYHVLHQNRLA